MLGRRDAEIWSVAVGWGVAEAAVFSIVVGVLPTAAELKSGWRAAVKLAVGTALAVSAAGATDAAGAMLMGRCT